MKLFISIDDACGIYNVSQEFEGDQATLLGAISMAEKLITVIKSQVMADVMNKIGNLQLKPLDNNVTSVI
jgi:hypothetical protein